MDIGELIDAIGVSELARRIGSAQSTVSYWRRTNKAPKWRRSDLEKIAEQFGETYEAESKWKVIVTK